jgi:hypothetical protein
MTRKAATRPASTSAGAAGRAQPETPIYLVGRYEQALTFYLRRTMTLVQHADEMGSA